MKRISITIKGRVQGVLMRRGMKSEADKLGIFGFAENVSDGSVFAIAEGEESNLKKFLDWCYAGSTLAKIESLEFRREDARNDFSEFSIERKGNYVSDKIAAFKNLSDHYLKKEIVPKHVVIIPDGNRRWAKQQGREAAKGHEQGAETTMALLEEAIRKGIPYFTLWGFSTENWNRSKYEIDHLMRIFRGYLKRIETKLHEQEASFKHFGRKDRLPQDIVTELHNLEETTRRYKKGSLGLALDYGGRDEILRAANQLRGSQTEIGEEAFSSALDTHNFPDPDLIIRTSGEQRLSGIMPWQAAYAELYFAEELFPDFGVPQFQVALADFNKRKRNFGA
ncbi:MAG: polyprenyl diphosphate synthase [Patescibacteria group bacterium]